MNLPLNSILCGDCFDLIRTIPSNSINLVITSPPYFQQRDYGGGIGNEKTVSEYLEILLALMAECVRVIKDDGNIVFNLGDKYEDSSLLLVPHQFALEVVRRCPLKLVNLITWVKRNPTPRQFKRRLVSSTEPFFHFVKSDQYYYDMDSFMANERPRKERNGADTRVGTRYFELIEQSNLTPEQKQLGRQKLIEVIQEVKAGKIEGFRMKIAGIHAEPFGGQAGGRQIQLDKNGFTIIRIYGNPIKRDVIEMSVESVKGSNHPAMYPVALVKEFLLLLTQENDVVLDPFMGSGSTAVACKQTKRHYIGFDLNPEYCAFAEKRLQEIIPHPPLLF